MKMMNCRMIAVLLCLLLSSALTADEILFKEQVGLCSPLSVTIPPSAISDKDVESGELSLYLTAHNKRAGWTVHCDPESLYVTDGETRSALQPERPKNSHLGSIPSGSPHKLTFKLPARAKDNGLSLEIPRGLFSMIAAPEGPFIFEVWKGLRPVISSYVDKMNRGVVVDATSVGDEGVKFTYEVPGVFRRESGAPVCFIRFTENQQPFKVKVSIETRKDGLVSAELGVAPRAETTPMPRPQSEVLTGICYYRDTFDQYDKFIAEDLGNLLAQWSDDTSAEFKEPYLKRLGEKGITYMGIYRSGRESRQDLDRYRQALGGRYLTNNIGEYAGYLYQDRKSADAINMPTDQTDMRDARDRFLEFINRRVRREHKVYDYILSTSGSALADYELMGGIDFMSSELYAVGANNINYAIAEMRGAARKWRPEYWGAWLAEEWQTFGVPYESSQKYDMLTVGLYANYMMGTNVIVLESGASTTQAEKHTRNPDGSVGSPKQQYDGHAPTQYRRTMHDFWQFVKANPRDEGTPQTHIALLRGNLDSWVGAFHGWIPAWAQHQTARQQPQWLMGDPERSWLAAMDVFTPICSGALKPYPNYWIGGMPYGQTDVVGLDEFSRPADIGRYRLAVLPGWNTMIPELMTTLNEYVRGGGTLVISLPQFLTRRDREAVRYEIADLIGGGDLSGLIDVKITGFTEASGTPASPALGGLKSGIFRKEQIASAELGDGVEVLATVAGKPYAVRQSRGKGRVVLLLGKEYPGKADTSLFYKNLLHKLAGEVEQPVTIAPVPGKEEDVRAVSFAAYPSKVYFLNADCVSSRTVTAVIDGRKQELTLAAHEFRIMERKK